MYYFKLLFMNMENSRGGDLQSFGGLEFHTLNVSATKRPLTSWMMRLERDDDFILKKQGALSINPDIHELRGVKVIPSGHNGKGERQWREEFNYTFQSSKKINK